MFYLLKMPKRRTFGHFLTFSEDKLFFNKKEDMFSKKRTYGNPTPNQHDSQLKTNNAERS